MLCPLLQASISVVCVWHTTNKTINSKNYYIMDTSMVILTVIFLVVFVAPFFIISAIKDHRAKKSAEAGSAMNSTTDTASK